VVGCVLINTKSKTFGTNSCVKKLIHCESLVGAKMKNIPSLNREGCYVNSVTGFTEYNAFTTSYKVLQRLG